MIKITEQDLRKIIKEELKLLNEKKISLNKIDKDLIVDSTLDEKDIKSFIKNGFKGYLDTGDPREFILHLHKGGCEIHVNFGDENMYIEFQDRKYFVKKQTSKTIKSLSDFIDSLEGSI